MKPITLILLFSFLFLLITPQDPKKQIRRKTQDGRLCASLFVQDKTTYTDCATSKTPDGQSSGREWCYLDSSYKATPNWGYCEPVLDFDKLMVTNANYKKELAKQINALNIDIESKINPALHSLDDIKYVKEQQDKIESSLSTMNTKMSKIEEIVNNLKKLKENYIQKQKTLSEIQFNLNRIEKDKEILNDNTNCKGMLLYEEDELGDGLVGKFYDNENWLGIYKEQKSNSIDYDWTDIEPIPGINIDNYSVEWLGWVKIPITDNYIFTVECDDGAELYINDELVVNHKTKNISSLKITKQKQFKSSSSSYHLIGGVKIRIKLRYYHSIHTSIYSKGQSFIRLYWENEEWEERIIDKNYLYSSFSYPPLKIKGYSPEEVGLSKLSENDYAFLDSKSFIVQDIPNELESLTQLKLKSLYLHNELEVYASTPSNVYVAILSHYPNPLDSDWEDTGLSMSLLQIDNSNNKATKKLIAKKSAELKIYKRKYKKGIVKISLSKTGINTQGIPMLVFFGFDMNEGKAMICTGKEKIISDSNSKSFKSCRASSELEGYQCEDGFRTTFRDEEGSMWAAKADGVGSWVEVYFDHYYELTKFEYKNRHNPSERNKQLELEFSNGQKMLIDLKNNDDIYTETIDSIKATSVKITIKSTYDSLNNGGAFAFYGISCDQMNIGSTTKINNGVNSNIDLIPPLFERDSTNIIMLNCRDSLSNSDKFLNVDFSHKIILKCPESCALSPYPVYGTGIYAKDSALCKSAYHNKKISSKGGLVILNIKKERDNYNRSTFKGSLSNGIKSMGKERSSMSLTFEEYIEEDVIILKPGTKVDIRIKTEKDTIKWVPAVIISVIDNSYGKFVKVAIDGENSKPVEYPYNKDIIHPCGEHVKGRECKGSLKKIKNSNPIVIRFVPKGYESSLGYLPDYGAKLDLSGSIGGSTPSYGWSVDMTMNARRRGSFETGAKSYLETFIEFPPSPNSLECTKPNPTKLCEPVFWRVKVGKGRYKITIYAGDVLKDFQMDLRVNNKILVKNKLIKKNTMEKFTDIIDAKNEFLEFTSVCEEHCEYSNTKINAIEIVPYEEKVSTEEVVPKEKEVCGYSFVNGRCLTGPDVIHCVYDDTSVSSTQYCNNDKVLVMIPETTVCKEHIGFYKCVYKMYSDPNECTKYCPKKCNSEGKCVY